MPFGGMVLKMEKKKKTKEKEKKRKEKSAKKKKSIHLQHHVQRNKVAEGEAYQAGILGLGHQEFSSVQPGIPSLFQFGTY